MDHDGADAASPRQSQAVVRKTGYSPPWADTSIIGIAGSSGSGKTSLALAIVESLNLPWVVVLSMVIYQPLKHSLHLPRSTQLILSQDSFYKPLTPAESIKAFLSEFDFDAPAAIDFDTLVEVLGHLKSGYCHRPILPMSASSFSDYREERRRTSQCIPLRSMQDWSKATPFIPHTSLSSRAFLHCMTGGFSTCLT